MKPNYLLAALISLAALAGCNTWSNQQSDPPSGTPSTRGAQDRSSTGSF